MRRNFFATGFVSIAFSFPHHPSQPTHTHTVEYPMDRLQSSTTHPVKVRARSGCSTGQEVWLARQEGGITILDSHTCATLHDISLPTERVRASQILNLTPVLDEVWATSIDGELLCFKVASREVVDVLRLNGSRSAPSLAHVSFHENAVLIASATGKVFVLNPATRRVVQTLATLSPCTFVAGHYSFVVAGDTEGRLYVWHLTLGELVAVHAESKSAVRHILHEPTTGTIWVARQNKNVDVYRLEHSLTLLLVAQLPSVAIITGMLEVSGEVVLATYCKKRIIVDARTASIVKVVPAVGKSFSHGLVKARKVELAAVWTLINDDGICMSIEEGIPTAAYQPPRFPPYRGDTVTSGLYASLLEDNATLGVDVERAKLDTVSMQEDLRKAQEEAHELRLRLTVGEDQAKAVELRKKDDRIRELEERTRTLQKDVTDITSKAACTEHERAVLQGDLSRLLSDVSTSRADASAHLAEISVVNMQLSKERKEKMVLEQRLHETTDKLSSLQAENARLCESIGNVATFQNADREVRKGIMTTMEASGAAELAEAQRMNHVLSSMLGSMEHTIRRQVEEAKDLSVLLNAYRRKVADAVTDPHLSALLAATVVRHPDRFEMDCDEATKAMLRNHNGPFIQFIDSLRTTDPDAYAKLMWYLQQPSTTDVIPPEKRSVVDELVALASKGGAITGADVEAIKHSIPAATPHSVPYPGAGTADLSAPLAQTAAASAASCHSTGPSPSVLGSLLPVAATPASPVGGMGSSLSMRGPAPPLPSADVLDQGSALQPGLADGEVKAQASSTSWLLRSQETVDEAFLKEQRSMFEFVLSSRRALVECLVLLHKRTVNACQVVEALTANSVSMNHTPSRRHWSSVVSRVVAELSELAASVVLRFLTRSEKQRLSV